jgi:hypothetical protein
MAYILKNTSGLISTRVTDVGRQKMSQGNFNISYFQIGDSEICYDCLPSTYVQTSNNIFEPCFNSHNSVGSPESNKQYIKYPLFVTNPTDGNTYGIPFMDSKPEPIFNAAAQRGFFSGDVNSWNVLVTTAYTISSEWQVTNSLIAGGNILYLTFGGNCSASGTINVGDFVTIYMDGTANCPDVLSCYPVLTYRVTGVSGSDLYLDRDLPDISFDPGVSKVLVYPSGMTVIYDTYTPSGHWYTDVINFESVCTTDAFDVKIWNMNIPWTENPAGLNTNFYVGYDGFGSHTYIGSKEYLGYNNNTGQTDSYGIFYYNSFGERVYTTTGSSTPSYTDFITTAAENASRVKAIQGDIQKAIAIVHYTNNTIDYFYGEKFAMEPFDPTNPNNTTGQARNFKISLPWLSWHKSTFCTCSGVTFYVDPPNFDDYGLFQVHYIQSNCNEDMNDPGHRYYNLWDTNPNSDGFPNRVGKVFPDQRIVVFDDEEIIAAMSYKSNRNWTLPAPKTSLITPNVCEGSTSGYTGIMSADTEYMYLTYRLEDTGTTWSYLHCNYYQKLQGPSSACTSVDQCVAVRFGNEFPCLTDTGVLSGFSANKFSVLCQKVVGDARPDPMLWREMDFTSQINLTPSGYILPSAITATTFVVCEENYNLAPIYDLSDYLDITLLNETGSTLNFGDEYYFYGVIDTDIMATIYEMRYLCNMASSQFTYSCNPTWTPGQSIYFTEIGLYDSDKDLLVVSKFQSPQKRIGVQQALVKFDF